MTPPVPPSRLPALPWLGQFAQDVHYGLRQLWKAPGFATISILTIALGIGACTALFSVVNKVILHPLDYQEAYRLVYLSANQLPKNPELPISPGIYNEWLRQATVFEDLAALTFRGAKLGQGDRYMDIYAVGVTTNFFPVFRFQPEKGRLFLPDEMRAGKDQVVILSHNLWKETYAGRDDVIGQTLRLDDQTRTIVGVVWDTERRGNFVYIPCTQAGEHQDFKTRNLWVEGRLKPGVTIQQAQMEMKLIAQRAALEHPDTEKDRGISVMLEIDGWSSDVKPQLYALLGAVGLLLLIACVNVASLLLARANARQKEIAVRAALGASRGRIIRQFLCESLLIAMFGGVLGVLMAYASMGPLIVLAKHFMPHADRIAVDGNVLVVMCGVMLLAGLGFGLVPALQATRGDLIGSIKESAHNSSGGRERLRVRNFLVILEISVALVLLINTGLLVRSLRAMQTFDQGLKPENVSGAQFNLNSQQRYNSPEKILGFTHAMLERVAGLPDVDSAGITVGYPSVGGGRSRIPQLGFILEGGHPPASPSEPGLITDRYAVTPDYFRVMGVPLIRGRVFNSHDSLGTARVVIVNREMVRRHFPGKDPIGQHIRLLHDNRGESPPTGTPPAPEIWLEIIGVVGDVRPRGPQSEILPQVYEAFDQNPEQLATLVVRATGPSPALYGAIKNVFDSMDKEMHFTTLFPLIATLEWWWTQQRFNSILFTLFSVIALILAAIGIYGVMAYSVTQRTHEIGIRMALGALPRDVLQLILRSGSRIVLIGLVIGTAGALATTRVVSALLFQVSPYDPVSFLAIITILSAVAFLACWIPARRATKVSPIVALRAE